MAKLSDRMQENSSTLCVQRAVKWFMNSSVNQLLMSINNDLSL